jgi:hypothetical protein
MLSFYYKQPRFDRGLATAQAGRPGQGQRHGVIVVDVVVRLWSVQPFSVVVQDVPGGTVQVIGVWPAARRQASRNTALVVIFRVINLLGIDAQSLFELAWLRGIRVGTRDMSRSYQPNATNG